MRPLRLTAVLARSVAVFGGRSVAGTGRANSTGRVRALQVAAVVGLLAGLPAGPFAGSSAVAAQPPPLDNVEPEIMERLAASGEATFWAILRDTADLSGAEGIEDRSGRGEFVVDELQDLADDSQAGLVARLVELGVPHEAFWIINAIEITADEAVLREVAERPEVAQIVADAAYHIPEPVPDRGEPAVQAVEWGIDRIRARTSGRPSASAARASWSPTSTRGVQYNHPALVRQYRGNLGGGNFDHNYNWFDPSNVCGNPSSRRATTTATAPTRWARWSATTGSPDPTRSASPPSAKWIAAKGCETSSCSLDALLAAGAVAAGPDRPQRRQPAARICGRTS